MNEKNDSRNYIPEHLRINAPVTKKVTYTNNPNGNLDIEKLIKKEARFWREEELEVKHNKKILCLNDFSIDVQDSSVKKIVYKNIYLLAEMGYQFLVYVNDNFKLYDINNINDIQYDLKHFDPLSEAQLNNLAANKGYTKESYYIIKSSIFDLDRIIKEIKHKNIFPKPEKYYVLGEWLYKSKYNNTELFQKGLLDNCCILVNDEFEKSIIREIDEYGKKKNITAITGYNNNPWVTLVRKHNLNSIAIKDQYRFVDFLELEVFEGCEDNLLEFLEKLSATTSVAKHITLSHQKSDENEKIIIKIDDRFNNKIFSVLKEISLDNVILVDQNQKTICLSDLEKIFSCPVSNFHEKSIDKGKRLTFRVSEKGLENQHHDLLNEYFSRTNQLIIDQVEESNLLSLNIESNILTKQVCLNVAAQLLDLRNFKIQFNSLHLNMSAIIDDDYESYKDGNDILDNLNYTVVPRNEAFPDGPLISTINWPQVVNERLRTIKIVTNDFDWEVVEDLQHQFNLNFIRKYAPNIECLDIVPQSDTFDTTEEKYIKFDRQDLSCSNPGLKCLYAIVEVPGLVDLINENNKSLRELTLMVANNFDFSCLSELENLQSLDIKFEIPPPDSLESDSSKNINIPLKSLRELTLSDFDENILSRIKCPDLQNCRLEKITLKNSGVYKIRELPKNISDIIHSSKNLVNLELQGIECLGDLKLEHISSVRGLKNLSITESRMTKLHHVEAILENAKNLKTLKCDIKLAKKIKEKDEIKNQLIVYEHKYTMGNCISSIDVGKSEYNRNSELKLSINPSTAYNPNKEYHLTKIFTPINYCDKQFEIDPSQYRLSVYNKIEISLEPSKRPFELEMLRNLDSTNCANLTDIYGEKYLNKFVSQENNSNRGIVCHLGSIHVSLTDKDYTSLPSISPRDTLMALYIDGLEMNHFNLVFDENAGQYLIKLNNIESDTFKVHYVIQPQVNTPPYATDQVLKIIKHQNDIRTYGAGEIENPYKLSGVELLKTMKTRRVGACRHRVLVFWDILRKELNISEDNIRIVCSDDHMFCEIKLNNIWNKFDLGGYEAKVKISDNKDLALDRYKDQKSDADQDKYLFEPDDGNNLLFDNRRYGFNKWLDKSNHKFSFNGVVNACMQSNGNNLLILTDDFQNVKPFALALSQQCKIRGLGFFYIRSPDDIDCSRVWIKRDPSSNQGSIESAKGGRLYHFIQTAKSGLIFIDWTRFTPSEIVKFNSILDEAKKVDGVNIDPAIKIISIYNMNAPSAYKGADFTSRHQEIIEHSASKADFEFQSAMSELNLAFHEPGDENEIVIELYASNDWKQRLLGSWNLKDGTYFYHEGPLLKAFKNNQYNIHLNNPPLHLEEFISFLKDLKIDGELVVEGETFLVPNEFWGLLSIGHEFDFESCLKHVRFQRVADRNSANILLNKATINRFLSHHEINKDRLLFNEGYIKSAKSKIIENVVLTESIDLSSWMRILDACKNEGVFLNIAIPQGIDVPKEIRCETFCYPLEYNDKSKNISDICSSNEQFIYIETNHIDHLSNEVVSQLLDKKQEVLLLDVSELNASDVFYQYIVSHDKSEFTVKYSDIWKNLKENKDYVVVLKGKPCNEIKNILTELYLKPNRILINGQMECLQGKLIVVSNDDLSPAFLCSKFPIQLNNSIENNDKEDTKNIEMINISDKFSISDESHLQSERELFFKQRYNALFDALAKGSCVYIIGKTGVGKSAFIESIVEKDPNVSLYFEISQLISWAQDSTDKLKILFIDEANTQYLNYTNFESIYNKNPFIIIDGKQYSLTQDHKIVFAGNPISYGQRNLPKFIRDHANTVEFHPIPKAVVYTDMLRPIFEKNNTIKSDMTIWGNLILEVYDFLSNLSETEVLITPRMLKYLALLLAVSVHEKREYEIERLFDFENYSKHVLPLEPSAISHEPQIDNFSDAPEDFNSTPLFGFTHESFDNLEDSVHKNSRFIDMSDDGDLTFTDIVRPFNDSADFSEKIMHPTDEANANIIENRVLTAVFDTVFNTLKDEYQLSFASWFEKMYQYKHVESNQSTESDIHNSYYFAPSRRRLSMALENLISIRNKLCEQSEHSVFTLPISGMILQGDPGSGKSEFVRESLRKYGFVQGDIYNEHIDLSATHKFYYLPASLSEEKSRALLLKAFNEGAILAADEFNCKAALERELNACLSGVHPETKKPPLKSGFLFIGTENGIGSGGRFKRSPAIQNRILSMEVTDYTRDEIITIAKQKYINLPHDYIYNTVQEFCAAVKYAKENHFERYPVFRDLLNEFSKNSQQMRQPYLPLAPINWLYNSYKENNPRKRKAIQQDEIDVPHNNKRGNVLKLVN